MQKKSRSFSPCERSCGAKQGDRGMINKKKSLAVFLTVCLIMTMMPSAVYAADRDTEALAILYTGDIHGAVDDNISLAGVASYANAMLKEVGYVELVDTGDALSGGSLANSSEGSFAVEALNIAGYGICVPGVNDFDFGVDKLVKELSAMAKYKYIACNFETKAGDTVFAPYELVTYGKTTIGYVGISEPSTADKSKASFVDSDGKAAYSFNGDGNGQSLYAEVQAAVDAAKKDGADYVIALAHLTSGSGDFSAKSIIQNTSGLTAFICGGSGSVTAGQGVADKDGDEVLLTSPAPGIQNIGVLTLSPGKTVSSQLVTAYNLRDIETKDAIDSLSEKYSSSLKQVVASSQHKLVSADENGIRIIGKTETNLGDLCADAYRAATGADIAFVEARDIQSDIPAGEVSYSDIVKALPGNNSVHLREVSGYAILDALEMSARLCPSNNEGFLQISGLTFDIQETVKSTVMLNAKGEFTGVSSDYRVTNVMINGKELELMDSYTLAATDKFFAGETGYTMFADGKQKSGTAITDNQALYDYVNGELGGNIGDKYAKSAGRIDFIRLARQSEIDAEIEAGVAEKLKAYSAETAALQKQVEQQKQIIDVKTVTIKASSAVKKNGSKRSIKLSWTLSKDIDGMKFQVYKSQSKNSGYKKSFTTSQKSYTNGSGIKKGKRYYYKVRGYKYINGKYYYTDWSNVTYKKVK